jgi:PAS domain S-box-containing protein
VLEQTTVRDMTDEGFEMSTCSLSCWENIIESSPDAIVAIRKGGEIIIFNAAAERLLGYQKSEVIDAMNIVDICPLLTVKTIMRDLRSDDYGGPGVMEKREVPLVDKRGEEIPVSISAAILYEDGREVGSVGFFTDLREKKRLERQLLRSEKLSSLGKLAAGIAHEINQPLTGVLTFSHLLLEAAEVGAVGRKHLELIARETARIKDIVQGILNFSRETPLSMRPMRIENVLDEMLEIVVYQDRFRGIELVRDFGEEVPEVVVDRSRLEQVFINIVFNAIEAMDGTGALTIRTRHRDGRVDVELVDSGPGIPDSIIDRIFDPFFTTKHSAERMGMGLGLAISYGIVKSHGGDLLVSSAPGRGTTFTVRLPAAGPAASG